MNEFLVKFVPDVNKLPLITVTEDEFNEVTDIIRYLDTQLKGGFEPSFGQFGIPVCRAIQNLRGKMVVPADATEGSELDPLPEEDGGQNGNTQSSGSTTVGYTEPEQEVLS